jgi:hypothetical protein
LSGCCDVPRVSVDIHAPLFLLLPASLFRHHFVFLSLSLWMMRFAGLYAVSERMQPPHFHSMLLGAMLCLVICHPTMYSRRSIYCHVSPTLCQALGNNIEIQAPRVAELFKLKYTYIRNITPNNTKIFTLIATTGITLRKIINFLPILYRNFI